MTESNPIPSYGTSTTPDLSSSAGTLASRPLLASTGHPSSSKIRETSSAHVVMNRRTRISRTHRMNWFLDHHDQQIKAADVHLEPKRNFSLVGIEARDGQPLVNDGVDALTITGTTSTYFYSKVYKFTVIFDFSPGVFTADSSGSMPFSTMTASFEQLIMHLVKPFTFPNSKIQHSPQLIVSLMGYSPYVNLETPATILHHKTVNYENVDEFLEEARRETNVFADTMIAFLSPQNYLRQKAKSIRRARLRKEAARNAPPEIEYSEEESEDDDESDDSEADSDDEDYSKARRISRIWLGQKRKRRAHPRSVLVPLPDSENEDDEEVEAKKPDVEWPREEKPPDFERLERTVPIPFQLARMLRLGIFGLAAGPENAQRGIVIITGGSLFIPDTAVVRAMALMFRTEAVLLSFVHVKPSQFTSSPMSIPSDDLLRFLSSVSFGCYVTGQELLSICRNEPPGSARMTRLRQEFLAWSCQKSPVEMEEPMPGVVEDKRRFTDHSATIRTNFFSALLVKIREGFFLTNLKIIHPFHGKRVIKADLRLPWTRDSKIDYRLVAYYDDCDEQLHDVTRKLHIETNFVNTPEIVTRNNDMQTAIQFVAESERFTIKILNYSTNPANYTITPDILNAISGVYACSGDSMPLPKLLVPSLEGTQFNAFWQPLLIADATALHRCCQSVVFKYTMRFTQNPELESDIIAAQPNFYDKKSIPAELIDFPLKKKIVSTVMDYFRRETTFCLAKNYVFVKIIRQDDRPPKCSWFTRIFVDNVMLSIRIVFIGDAPLDVRNKVVARIKEDLATLPGIAGWLTPLLLSTDAKLVRYRTEPKPWHCAEPKMLPYSTQLWEMKQKIHHSSLMHFLVPRREVWEIEPFYTAKTGAPRFGIEVKTEIINVLLKRRIKEGFRVGYVSNGIMNFIREGDPEGPPKLEQFVVFCIHKRRLTLQGDGVWQLRAHYAKAGFKLEDQRLQNPIRDLLHELEAAKQAIQTEINDLKLAIRERHNKYRWRALNAKVNSASKFEDPKPETMPPWYSRDMEVIRQLIDIDFADLDEVLCYPADSFLPNRANNSSILKRQKKLLLSFADLQHSVMTAYEAALEDDGTQHKATSLESFRDWLLEKKRQMHEYEESLKVVDFPEQMVRKGTFLVTELWSDPGPQSANRGATQEKIERSRVDRAVVSILMTFRMLQSELDRESGIVTATMQHERFAMHSSECPPIIINHHVTLHTHLYNIPQLCLCGERFLMMLPTLEFRKSDEKSVDRLDRVLECFNREMQNFMPQYFFYEDYDNTWARLAKNIPREYVVNQIDYPEFMDGERSEYDTDGGESFDGSLSPTSLKSFSFSSGVAKNRFAEMSPEELRRQVLGNLDRPHGGHCSSSSGESVSSPPGTPTRGSIGTLRERKEAKELSAKESCVMTSSVTTDDGESSPHSPISEKSTEAGEELEFLPGKKKIRKKREALAEFKKTTGSRNDAVDNSADTASSSKTTNSGQKIPDVEPVAPPTFYAYYTRRDIKTVIIVIVPTSARSVLRITEDTAGILPVLAFMVDETRVLDVVHNASVVPTDFTRTSIENFCPRNDLVHLNWQINVAHVNRRKPASSSMDSPMLSSSGTSDIEDDAQPKEYSSLYDFCVNNIHEHVFSRAYAQAVYLCLGTRIPVPIMEVQEVLEDRCSHTSVEMGSVRPLLQITCTHLSSYLQSKRVNRYQRHLMPDISPGSSSRSSTDSEVEMQQIFPYTVSMNPFCYSESENNEICKMEKTEFRTAFEEVLAQHQFFRVPSFADYYYYWPKQDADVGLESEALRIFNLHHNKYTPEETAKIVERFEVFTDENDEVVSSKADTAELSVITNATNSVDSGNDATSSMEDETVSHSHSQSLSSVPTTDKDPIGSLCLHRSCSACSIHQPFLPTRVHVTRQPLFLQFFVNVPRTNDIISFPVDYIPNCLKEVINRCTDDQVGEEDRKQLDLFDVQVEMYVLTTLPTEHEEQTKRRMDPRKRKTTEDGLRLLNEKVHSDSYIDLDERERKVVLDLKQGIHRMLDTEQILVLTRYFDLQKSYKNISVVLDFVKRESELTDGGHASRVQFAQSDVSFVLNPELGLRRLCERLEDAKMSYCNIRCVRDEKAPAENANIVFYCCSVDYFDEFCREHFDDVDAVKFDYRPRDSSNTEDDVASDLSLRDDGSTGPLDDKVKHKQTIHDFWLIAQVQVRKTEPTPTTRATSQADISCYFFQRSTGRHAALFQKFTDRVIEEIKWVNRSLLLEDMAKSMVCQLHLIDANCKPLKPQAFDEQSDEPREIKQLLIQRLIQQEQTFHSDPLLERYPPGYFFCPMVWHHWFSVNKRLRETPANHAMSAIRLGLKNYELRNRHNIWLRQEANGNVVYVYFFDDIQAIQDIILNDDEDWLAECRNMLSGHRILMAVFGVADVGDLICVDLVNEVHALMDERRLKELQFMLMKDGKLRLTAEDVTFIQEDPAKPTASVAFALPPYAAHYLASISTYVRQQLQTRYPEPLYAEGRQHRAFPILNDHTEGLESRGQFEPFPFDAGEPLPIEHWPRFFVVLGCKENESVERVGIGCFEMRIVDSAGKLVLRSDQPAGKLTPASTSLLYPRITTANKPGAFTAHPQHRYQQLTKLRQVESIDEEAELQTLGYKPFYVQFYVWEKGDIGFAEFQTRLRIVCEQALADVVVEFGLLAQQFFETTSTENQAVTTPTETTSTRPLLQRQNTFDAGSASLPRTPVTLTPSIGAVASASSTSLVRRRTGGQLTTTTGVGFKEPITKTLSSPPKTPSASGSLNTSSAAPDATETPATGISLPSPPETTTMIHGAAALRLRTATCRPSDADLHFNADRGEIDRMKVEFLHTTMAFAQSVIRTARPYADLCNSFEHHSFVIDDAFSAVTVMRVIFSRFQYLFKSYRIDRKDQDSVTLLKPEGPPDVAQRLVAVSEEDEVPVVQLTQDRGEVIQLLGQSDVGSSVDLCIVVHNAAHMRNMIKQTLAGEREVREDLEQVCERPESYQLKFGPTTDPFVPRRRFIIVVNRKGKLGLYMYNVALGFSDRIRLTVSKAVEWMNAKSRLIRDIGFHKMRVSHLCASATGPATSQGYESLVWRNPEALVDHNFPSDSISTEFMDDLCQNHRRLAAIFRRPFDHMEPSFVPKYLAPNRFDDQAIQLLSVCEVFQAEVEAREAFYRLHRAMLPTLRDGDTDVCQNLPADVVIEERDLKIASERAEAVHYVETPLLLLPEWRKKVAAIRNIGADHGTVSKKKQNALVKLQRKRSVKPEVKPRSHTVNESMLSSLRRSPSTDEPELKLQYMLANNYVAYLQHSLGAHLIRFPPHSSTDFYSLDFVEYTTAAPPVAWLYIAHPAGLLFINVHFLQPYFSIRVLMWQKGHVDRYCQVDQAALRDFFAIKSEVTSRCHIHSFTYDFHLGIVSTYLTGGPELLFNRGYNTSDFIIDFLQYYRCRPPVAKNIILEGSLHVKDLKVSGKSLWTHFLNNEAKYGWKVVRLKTGNEGSDDFMLVTKVGWGGKTMDQDYEAIRLVTNDAANSEAHEILLRYYIVMVNNQLDNVFVKLPEIDEVDMKLSTNDTRQPEIDRDADMDIQYDSDPQSTGSSAVSQHRPASVGAVNALHMTRGHGSSTSFAGRDSTDFWNDDTCRSPCASPTLLVTASQDSQHGPATSVLPHTLGTDMGIDASELRSRLVEPRRKRHRKTHSIGGDPAKAAAIPPERVTYVYFYNDVQRKLQYTIEEFSRASHKDLSDLITKASDLCYLDFLWSKLVSLETLGISKQASGGAVFPFSSRSESAQDQQHIMKQVTSTALNEKEWNEFLRGIGDGMLDMHRAEKRLDDLFNGVYYEELFAFLIGCSDGLKSCRFLEFESTKNLVILNPSSNSAMLFEKDMASNQLRLYMLRKPENITNEETLLFNKKAIQSQFFHIMDCISTYIWTDLFKKSMKHS